MKKYEITIWNTHDTWAIVTVRANSRAIARAAAKDLRSFYVRHGLAKGRLKTFITRKWD